MKIEIELPDFDGNAIDVIWENGGSYISEVHDNNCVIRANAQGLVSLAKQMLYMAFSNLPLGSHVHYGSFITQNTDDKYELIIEKLD